MLLTRRSPARNIRRCFEELTPEHMSTMQAALKGSRRSKYQVGAGSALLVGRSRQGQGVHGPERQGRASRPTSRRASGFEDLVEPKGFNLETAEAAEAEVQRGPRQRCWPRDRARCPEVKERAGADRRQRDGYFGPEKATAAVAITPRTTGAHYRKAKLAAICRLVAAAAGPKLKPPAVGVTVTSTTAGPRSSLAEENRRSRKASSQHRAPEGVERLLRRADRGLPQADLRPRPDARLRQGRHDHQGPTRRPSTRTTEETSRSRDLNDRAGAPGGDTLTKPNTGIGRGQHRRRRARARVTSRPRRRRSTSPSEVTTTDSRPARSRTC